MTTYRSEIDGIRAIAIVGVVLFHGWASVFPGGYVGVDIFFVISGYLITSIIFREINEGDFTYAKFYERRARRIFPALLAMICVVSVLVIILLMSKNLIDYGKLLIYTVLFGSNFRLAATPGYFDQSMQESPLLHMWSLAVEEQFYLIWPALLTLILLFLPPKRRLLAILTLFAASFIAAEVLVHTWPRSAFFHLPSRGWELLAGALLAMRFFPKLNNKLAAESLAALGVVLMIAPIFLYDDETRFPGLAALPPVLGAALVIYATEGEGGRIKALLSLRAVVFIGLISYSLYLWHWPVFSLASYVLMRPLTSGDAFVCAFLAVALAVLSWRFVERPFRKRPEQTSRALRRPAILPVLGIGRPGQFAIAITIAFIALGSYFQASKGMLWRFSPDVRLALASVEAAQCPERPGKAHREELKDCRFGDWPVDVVLWGDSHARHYFPIIERIFNSGSTFVTPGCVPLQNAQLVTQSGNRLARDDCHVRNQFAMERILALRPSIVVLASRWTLIERLYLTDGAGPRTRATSEATFVRALRETVATLTAAGIKVVLMGQAPEMASLPARCFSPFQSPRWENCAIVPRSEEDLRQKFVNATLKELADNDPRVFFFSPFADFCDDVFCHAIKDRKLRYEDKNHLTVSGVLMMTDAFRKALPAAFMLPQQAQGMIQKPMSTGG